MRCRCHSGKTERRCCGPLHAGRPAPTPLALMRSRYAAYAKGLVDYLIDTTDRDGPHAQPDRARWAAELRDYCAGRRFVGLEILSAPPPVGDQGEVTFRAHLQEQGRAFSFVERSTFRRIGGRWVYVSAIEGA